MSVFNPLIESGDMMTWGCVLSGSLGQSCMRMLIHPSAMGRVVSGRVGGCK